MSPLKSESKQATVGCWTELIRVPKQLYDPRRWEEIGILFPK